MITVETQNCIDTLLEMVDQLRSIQPKLPASAKEPWRSAVKSLFVLTSVCVEGESADLDKIRKESTDAVNAFQVEWPRNTTRKNAE